MSKFEARPFKSLFELEDQILSYWQENRIYEQTLKKNSPGDVFSFYDGPPFITGTPHYATLLPSVAKDIIPRYQTMKGKYVRRRWGWDTHGLPAENQVEKKLGLKTKKDIETLGVEKFIAECRAYVAQTSEQWRWYIDRIGRWADLDDAYRTDDLNYMESVMQAFKQLYEKGLIYRGRRTSLYCPRCATPLSKFEVTMDEGSYRDVEDPGVTVAFPLVNDDVSLLAWTTTPWTLPANMALAVDEKAEYVKVTDGKSHYILAHEALPLYADADFKIVERFNGKKMVGWQYEPLYTFAPTNPETDYRVYAADFVTMEEGTGVVHVAPGFGEDDTKLGEQAGLTLFETLTEDGHFTNQLGPFSALYYKKADPLIIADLSGRQRLFKEEKITHSYPHCYRCETPLIYKSQVAWFMSIEPIRQQLLETNDTINWVPKHFGTGRFRYNLETAPDWSLSRTRYWGSPIPVWETDDGEIYVAGSIAELEKMSGQKITDLHRPAIDKVVLSLPSGKKAHRVREVLDCWFESGAMPYAQDHYPFENKKVFAKYFPADFIVEYTGQLRGWFYYLHVLGNALKNQNAFRQVVVHGVVLGNDGRKMSKSFGNYPDPRAVIEKYGAESLRLLFMTSGVMRGDEVSVKEEDIRDQSRVLQVLHNTVRYFLTYANSNNFEPGKVPERATLDRWIKVRLEKLVDDIDAGLGTLDFPRAARAIRPFIEDLSTWYIRRSRDRFVAGDEAALQTMYELLIRFSQAVAPILPFSAEHIYRLLTEETSVHLASFPVADSPLISENAGTLQLMDQVRQLASAAHKLRAEAALSLRQPLARLSVHGFNDLANQPEYLQLLQDEVNVKAVMFDFPEVEGWASETVGEGTLYLDTALSEELEREGRYRELVRLIQEERKRAGFSVGDKVAVEYATTDPAWRAVFEKHLAELSQAVQAKSILEVKDEAPGLTPLATESIAIKLERA
jgi:isoleucyl-tRNA synthetase